MNENRKFWDDLYSENYEEYKDKYLNFMYNPGNIGNCKGCPENHGHNGHEANGRPCGQQNCWVVCHCRQM